MVRHRRGNGWSRPRRVQRPQRRRVIPAAHLAYFLRDRRGNAQNREYLVVWYDLSETWVLGDSLEEDGWVNEMLQVDLWVNTQRRLPFLYWSRSQGFDIEGSVAYLRRIRELWGASNSRLAIQNWARGEGYYFEGANIAGPRGRVVFNNQQVADFFEREFGRLG